MIKQALYIHKVASINPLCSLNERFDVVQESIVEPDYKLAIPFPTQRRRMSRIIKLGVSCAISVIEDIKVDAIITATGLGCMVDTQKFYDSVIDTEEQLPNPTSFIQSTFNTIGGQIALLTKNHSYNMTHTHRAFSFENSIIDSAINLTQPEVYNVLLGAFDEKTETQECISRRMGLYKNHKAGEGSSFFMLSSELKDNSVRIVDIKTLYKTNNIHEELIKFLHINKIELSSIELLLSGESIEKCSFKDKVEDIIYFKDYCGEYHTSSAFATWLACEILRGVIPKSVNIKIEKMPKTVLIYNNYKDINYSFIVLQKE